MRHVLVTLMCLTSLSSFAVHAELLCTYQARISEQDKVNSKGKSLLQGKTVSKTVAAAIIRQDRANYHEFGKQDDEDEGDCVFADKDNRALLEKKLARGSADNYALRQIIFHNPLIRVKIHSDSISVTILSD